MDKPPKTNNQEEIFKVGIYVSLAKEATLILEEIPGINIDMPFKIQEILQNPRICDEEGELIDEGGETVILEQNGKCLPAISIKLINKFLVN